MDCKDWLIPCRPGSVRPGRVAALLAVVALAVAGCGKPVGQVSGKVTRGDQPVAGAELHFQNEDGSEHYRGLTGDDGEYRLDYGAKKGVAPGVCKIAVGEYTRLDGKPLPAGEEGAALKGSGRVAKRLYVFEHRIEAGTNRVDLDLNKGKLEK